jgi:integrase
MIIKRNIIFSLENRKKDGKPIIENVPIRMRLIYNGKRIDFSTGHRIDIAKWDSIKQRVKNGCTNKLKQTSTEINADLTRYSNDIQSIFKEFEVKSSMPAPGEIKKYFDQKARVTNNKGEPETNPLFNCLNEFIKENGKQNDWAEATNKKFDVVRNHLKSFNPFLTFASLNEKGLQDYMAFLQHEKKMRNSTVLKQLGCLKWFLRWGLKKGWHNSNAFLTFRPKLKTTQKKVIFLTWDELTKLRNYAVPTDKIHLERTKDVFLFSCFTGLRYSDVFNLKRSDIKADHIEITTVKTSDSLVIELNDHSRTILKKYGNVEFENNRALPVISNQKMNDQLKELAALAEINSPVRETYFKGNKRTDEIKAKHELLSTHAGRRTFICNALALGIQPQVIMKWTGHSDYKAMKPYIDVADDIKATAMGKFNSI